MVQIFKVNRKALAKELGISTAYVSMILSGERKPIVYKKKIRQLLNRAIRQLEKAA